MLSVEELGGRVSNESKLPGLNEWVRVRDYRVQQLIQMPNVEIYRASRLDAKQVIEFGFEHICVATGSAWRRNGIGRYRFFPIEGWDLEGVLSVDEQVK